MSDDSSGASPTRVAGARPDATMDDGRAVRSVGTTDRGAVMASEEGSSRSGVVSARGLALVVVAAGAALVLGYLGLRDHVDALNRAAGVHFGSGVADIIYYDLQ